MLDARFAGLHAGDRFKGDGELASARYLAWSTYPLSIAVSMSMMLGFTMATTMDGSTRSIVSQR